MRPVGAERPFLRDSCQFYIGFCYFLYIIMLFFVFLQVNNIRAKFYAKSNLTNKGYCPKV